MGRLKPEFIDRIDRFCDRVLDVADAGEKRCSSGRILEQIRACGTSVGANACEADEAISRPDFVKCIGIARRELGEVRFWLRLFGRRGWVTASRMEPLMSEAVELTRVMGAIVVRSSERSGVRAS